LSLADFGVTGQLAGNKKKMETVIGTPFFLAPEIILAEEGYTSVVCPYFIVYRKLTLKVDIWSLGISCIEMSEMAPPHASANPMRVFY